MKVVIIGILTMTKDDLVLSSFIIHHHVFKGAQTWMKKVNLSALWKQVERKRSKQGRGCETKHINVRKKKQKKIVINCKSRKERSD